MGRGYSPQEASFNEKKATPIHVRLLHLDGINVHVTFQAFEKNILT